jgi:hypothetical protein
MGARVGARRAGLPEPESSVERKNLAPRVIFLPTRARFSLRALRPTAKMGPTWAQRPSRHNLARSAALEAGHSTPNPRPTPRAPETEVSMVEWTDAGRSLGPICARRATSVLRQATIQD